MRKKNFSFFPILIAVSFLLCIFVPAVSMAADTGSQDTQAMKQSGKQMPSSDKAMENQQDAERIVENANSLLDDLVQRPNNEILASEFRNAAGVFIVPGVIQAGLIAGGSRGTGVLVTRNQDQWNLPVFASVTGGSLGAQIGVESTDLLMVFRKQKDIQKILNGDNFTLGVDASVAAGSADREAGTSTRADILVYKRAKGLFAGLSLTGSIINLDTEPLVAYYNVKPGQGAVRGYYGDEKQLVRKIAGMTDEEAKKQNLVKNVPESARQLQDTLKNFAAGGGRQ